MNAGLLMSEVVDNGATAGALLREARQACGMHIAALAVALKVPVSKLEALEADDHTALPDTVFVRALAASVCRTLKIDPVLILSRLPQSESPKLSTNSAGLNAPVKGNFGKHSVMSSSSFSSPSSSSRSFVLVVLVLLIGAMVLYFYPRHTGQEQNAAETSDPVALAAPVQGLSTDTASNAAPLADRPASGVDSVNSSPSMAASPYVPASSEAVAVVAEVPVVPVAPAGTLVLRARSESWVQVRDGAGAVALQRNLVAGESVSVTAPPPLAVVIGRADATEVLVKGKPFDLVPVTRENVARFEVK